MEVIFRQLDFMPLFFDSFAEMSSNVKVFVDMVAEYGVEYLDTSMTTTTPDVVG